MSTRTSAPGGSFQIQAFLYRCLARLSARVRHNRIRVLILMAAFRSLFSRLFGGESSKSSYKPAKIYDGLRKQILQFTAERLGASANQKVLAVLMETGYPEAVATLAAVMDGSASLYFSNGGGIIGGGEKPGQNAAARKLVAKAAEFESECAPTTEFTLPQKAHTRFCIITERRLTAEARKITSEEENTGCPRSFTWLGS